MDRILAEFTDVVEVSASSPSVSTWRATDPATGKKVLIKRFPDDSHKAQVTKSLGLRHPGIVPSRRWISDSGYFYIIRDWTEGENLRDCMVRNGSKTFDGLRSLLDPVLDSLEYAHSAGQIHGAVMPENVLITQQGRVLITDFGSSAHSNGSRGRYSPPDSLSATKQPTPRADYYSLCEIYKEYLPDRPVDDEVAVAARQRILRNLGDVQTTSLNAEEFRFKIDAVTRMAELLGFCTPKEASAPVNRRLGPRLVCQVTPASPSVAAGSGTTIVLTLWNEGDLPLQVEAVGSDVVWLNYHTRFTPFVIPPDGERDLIFTVSAARLNAGVYTANLVIRSNNGMMTNKPPQGEPWHSQNVSVPIIVQGVGGDKQSPVPMANRLPLQEPVKPPLESNLAPSATVPDVDSEDKTTVGAPAIACIQEPDPGLVRHGQTAVLHVGVKNVGSERLRIDRVSTHPSWLSYPGEFQPLWIEPGDTQFLGFSVSANTLPGGDYKAKVTFVTSSQQNNDIGQRNIWREMTCEVRVRVLLGKAGTPQPVSGAGCSTFLAGLLGVSALIVYLAMHL